MKKNYSIDIIKSLMYNIMLIFNFENLFIFQNFNIFRSLNKSIQKGEIL